MKNIFSTLIIFALFASTAFAQKAEPAQAQINYHFIHVRDTTQRNRPYTENLTLLLGRNASAYSSIDNKLQGKQLETEVLEQVKNAPNPDRLDLVLSNPKTTSKTEYFQFAAEHKLFIKQQILNDYLTEEPLPVINWHIVKDTMSIQSLRCQKATAHFKGRDYEAWFCADLPFYSGPWKLNGLPGLIVQAADTKKEVVFEFAGFNDVSRQNLMVSLPNDVITTSQKEFDRLVNLRATNPQAFNNMPVTTKKSPLDMIDTKRINSINVKASGDTFSRTINNPVELPEAKK